MHAYHMRRFLGFVNLVCNRAQLFLCFAGPNCLKRNAYRVEFNGVPWSNWETRTWNTSSGELRP